MRRDWVNGPNSVFRFILGSFFNQSYPDMPAYDAFYFMDPCCLLSLFQVLKSGEEMDAIPVREAWLDQFVLEALDYPRAAIRGSAYRGA